MTSTFLATIETTPPGAMSRHSASTSGSGSSRYISTPWQRTASKRSPASASGATSPRASISGRAVRPPSPRPRAARRPARASPVTGRGSSRRSRPAASGMLWCPAPPPTSTTAVGWRQVRSAGAVDHMGADPSPQRPVVAVDEAPGEWCPRVVRRRGRHRPVRPSMSSRRMSAWPAWRDTSSRR